MLMTPAKARLIAWIGYLRFALNVSKQKAACQEAREEIDSGIMPDLTCANCGSESTMTFEMANAGGTSYGQFGGMTYSQGAGVGGFGGRGFQQTQLAARLAPPRGPGFFNTPTIILFIASVSIFVFFSASNHSVVGLALSLIAVGTLIYWRRPLAHAETAAYQAQLEQWRRSIVCLRCGHTWVS